MDTLIPSLPLAGDQSTLGLGTDLSLLAPVPVHASTVRRHRPLKDLHLSVLGLWQLLSALSPGISPRRIPPPLGRVAGRDAGTAGPDANACPQHFCYLGHGGAAAAARN